jgi:hypothetical protein
MDRVVTISLMTLGCGGIVCKTSSNRFHSRASLSFVRLSHLSHTNTFAQQLLRRLLATASWTSSHGGVLGGAC